MSFSSENSEPFSKSPIHHVRDSSSYLFFRSDKAVHLIWAHSRIIILLVLLRPSSSPSSRKWYLIPIYGFPHSGCWRCQNGYHRVPRLQVLLFPLSDISTLIRRPYVRGYTRLISGSDPRMITGVLSKPTSKRVVRQPRSWPIFSSNIDSLRSTDIQPWIRC